MHTIIRIERESKQMGFVTKKAVPMHTVSIHNESFEKWLSKAKLSCNSIMHEHKWRMLNCNWDYWIFAMPISCKRMLPITKRKIVYCGLHTMRQSTFDYYFRGRADIVSLMQIQIRWNIEYRTHSFCDIQLSISSRLQESRTKAQLLFPVFKSRLEHIRFGFRGWGRGRKSA